MSIKIVPQSLKAKNGKCQISKPKIDTDKVQIYKSITNTLNTYFIKV